MSSIEDIFNKDFYNQDTFYDPNLSERICCVELANNNKIYLNYKESSTIMDVYNFLYF